MAEDWDARVAAVWADDTLSDADRIEQIDALAAELDEGDALGLFERAGARDSAGIESEAEPLYRRALAAGLDEYDRARAVIQLASTLRNLGRTEEALGMLREEFDRGPRRAPARCRRGLLRVGAGVVRRGRGRGIRRPEGARAAPAPLHAVRGRVRR